MNSHQSLAEALEMCKYTENFTSRVGGGGGTRRWSRGDPPRPPKTHPTATEHPRPRTVASLDIPIKINPRPE